MKTYIGVKLVNAKPMSRLAYNQFRGWTLPADENGDDEGFLVEYTDGGKANTAEYEGYVSWSPKDVFERAYNEVDDIGFGLNFGDALKMLEHGLKVARAGWNGAGMFVYYVPANEYPANGNTLGTMTGMFKDDMVPYRAYIAMKTAQNDVVPWVASQTDILAKDWVVVA